MNDAALPAAMPWQPRPLEDRLATARRIFRIALGVTTAATAFCLVAWFTGFGQEITGPLKFDAKAMGNLAIGIIIFNVLWGGLWYGIKNLLLKFSGGFDRAERRVVFSSRMDQPFDVPALVAKHSERRIRIIDMIGRRGRFMTIGLAGFFYLYTSIATEPQANFATAFLSQNLFDGLATAWVYLAVFYYSGFLGSMIYGAHMRIMDGVLARANVLTITTLWAVFKLVMLPIGGQLSAIYPPAQFAAVFALIWGSYMITDTLAEVGGSLWGKQTIRVIGIGDINRKSIAGTVSGFVGSLVFCTVIVLANSLPAPFFALALLISISNTLLELYSPRGTDDFTMATGNALLCWAFGVWVLGQP